MTEYLATLVPPSLDLWSLGYTVGWILVGSACVVLIAGSAGWFWMAFGASVSADQRPEHWDRSLEDWGDLSEDDRGLVESIASLRPISRGRVVDLEQRRYAMDDRQARRRRELDTLLLNNTHRRVH